MHLDPQHGGPRKVARRAHGSTGRGGPSQGPAGGQSDRRPADPLGAHQARRMQCPRTGHQAKRPLPAIPATGVCRRRRARRNPARLDSRQLEHAPPGVQSRTGLRRVRPTKLRRLSAAAQVREVPARPRIVTGGGGTRAARSASPWRPRSRSQLQPQVDGQKADACRARGSRAASPAPRPGPSSQSRISRRARTSPVRRHARRMRDTPPSRGIAGLRRCAGARAPRGSRPEPLERALPGSSSTLRRAAPAEPRHVSGSAASARSGARERVASG